jgi:hypothetical protein
MWVVADLDEDYITKMEDVLETYEKPYDPQQPVVCLDEKPVTLHADIRPPSLAQPGREARRDNEYERCGTANVFWHEPDSCIITSEFLNFVKTATLPDTHARHPRCGRHQGAFHLHTGREYGNWIAVAKRLQTSQFRPNPPGFRQAKVSIDLHGRLSRDWRTSGTNRPPELSNPRRP